MNRFSLSFLNSYSGVSMAGNKVGDVESIGRLMVEFYAVFDKWHCGLNQL